MAKTIKTEKVSEKVRKNTVGVPRITAGVVKMTPEQREVWFNEKTTTCNVEQKAEVRSRLDSLNAGKYTLSQGQGKNIDFDKAFAKADMKTLLDLRATLATAIEAKRDAAVAEIAAQEKELADRKAALAVPA